MPTKKPTPDTLAAEPSATPDYSLGDLTALLGQYAGYPVMDVPPHDPALPRGLMTPTALRCLILPDGRALPVDLPNPYLQSAFPDLFPAA